MPKRKTKEIPKEQIALGEAPITKAVKEVEFKPQIFPTWQEKRISEFITLANGIVAEIKANDSDNSDDSLWDQLGYVYKTLAMVDPDVISDTRVRCSLGVSLVFRFGISLLLSFLYFPRYYPGCKYYNERPC